MSNHNNSNGRTWLGATLIIIGALLFMDNFHLTFFQINIFSWPVILLISGIFLLINHKGSGFAILLIILGGVGIASNFLHISIRSVFIEYWPFMLILFGIYLIFKKNIHHKKIESDFIEKDEYFLDIFSMFGDTRKKINITNFLGGKTTSLFSDLKIDLKNSQIQSGVRVLDTLTMFGATEIFIPSNWQIVIKVTTIFGGFEDHRIMTTQNANEDKKVLVIKGLVLFGSGEIKN